MYPIQEYQKDNQVIKVYQDIDPLDPRKEWDHLGILATWHRKYCLGDVQPKEDINEYIKALPEGAVVLPVYMYDHSGITISTKPFSCPWDSGLLGTIYTTKERVTDLGEPWDNRLQIERLLKQEIEIYDQYLRGDVYGYEYLKLETCPECGHVEEEHIDSCWGFFGWSAVLQGLTDYLGLSENVLEEIWERKV